jgi:hypothetical protein
MNLPGIPVFLIWIEGDRLGGGDDFVEKQLFGS